MFMFDYCICYLFSSYLRYREFVLVPFLFVLCFVWDQVFKILTPDFESRFCTWFLKTPSTSALSFFYVKFDFLCSLIFTYYVYRLQNQFIILNYANLPSCLLLFISIFSCFLISKTCGEKICWKQILVPFNVFTFLIFLFSNFLLYILLKLFTFFHQCLCLFPLSELHIFIIFMWFLLIIEFV